MISIIIPVYNGEKYINRAIESVMSQQGDWELIIVDDNSTDRSWDIIEELSNSDKRIRAVKSSSKGVTEARIAGALQAKYPFLFFMDVDDEIPHDTIEAIQIILEKNPQLDIVVGDILELRDGIITQINYSTPQIKKGQELFDFIINRRIGFLWGKAIRKSLFLSIPFNPSKLKFCEDYIQMLQLSLKATYVDYIGKSSYIYIQNSDSACNRIKSRKDYAMQFYDLCVALKILFNHPIFDSSNLTYTNISPQLRLKVMFLYYCRLYLAVSGSWKIDPENLKATYLQILQDKSLYSDPLYDRRRNIQTILSYYCPWLVALIYIPLLKYKYHRIK